MKDTISISMGNTKMGPIPSFSLMPILTCNPTAACVCSKGSRCYAYKLVRRRKVVYDAWYRNTCIATDVPKFKKQMSGWLAMYQPKAFRIHVSGDFFAYDYFKAWCEIARDNPNVKFFAFTKCWTVIERGVRDKVIPKNLSIILSAWIVGSFGWMPPMNLRKMFPVAWIERGGKYNDIDAIIEGMKSSRRGLCKWNKCNGNCAECAMCFNRKRKDGDIVFELHN